MSRRTFLFVNAFFALLLFSSQVCAQTAPPSGVVGWWAGDGDGRDISGNGFNGTLVNSSYGVCQVGQCFDFRAGGAVPYLEVADNALLKPAQFTIEAWVKFTPTFDDYAVAIAKGYASGDRDSYALGTSPVNANPQFFTTHNGSVHQLAAPTNLANPNSWNHLAASYDGVTKRLYVNGALVASAVVNHPISYDVNPAPLTVGADWENSRAFYRFNGFVDEPTLYNRALSDMEIAAIYNAGVGGKLKSAPTSAGANSQTVVGDQTLTFQNVNAPGTTTEYSIDPTTAGTLPGGYTQTGLGYNISTTAISSGPINLCFHLPSINDATDFSKLRILHSESGALVDKTIAYNFTARLVCGSVSSLSPFVIANGLAPTAAPASLGGKITDAAGSPLAGATVNLSGSRTATTITHGDGSYHFDNLEPNQFYTVTPSLANYHFSPANRSFSLISDKTDATFTGNQDASQSANAVDTVEYFIRQHYLDFLDREPDQGGLDYWSDQIAGCNGEAKCIHNRRIDVSAAYFMSDEFQDTGSYVYRLYKGVLGRQVGYQEFSTDRQQVIGGDNLDDAKAAFADSFVQRPEFIQKYSNANTAERFIDTLIENVRLSSGVDLTTQRNTLVAKYNSGSSLNESRSLAIRQAIEDGSFKQAEYNRAFVLMQYFGYLRRDADESGYQFWLNVLNNREPNNYRGMVCSFITSAEYQKRFSSVLTHSNGECGQ